MTPPFLWGSNPPGSTQRDFSWQMQQFLPGKVPDPATEPHEGSSSSQREGIVNPKPPSRKYPSFPGGSQLVPGCVPAGDGMGTMFPVGITNKGGWGVTPGPSYVPCQWLLSNSGVPCPSLEPHPPLCLLSLSWVLMSSSFYPIPCPILCPILSLPVPS